MRPRLLASVALVVAVLLLVAVPTVSGKKPGQIMDFQSMVGVPKALGGAAGSIRGIPGAGLPWVVDSAKGDLSADGVLEVKVRGPVIDPNDPDAIARGVAGTNPSPTFLAAVSCLAADGSSQNGFTDPFPATTGLGGGDAEVEVQLTLPQPCIAPIVLVTSPGRAWFAATGG
jgi:hypothetical protein